MTEDKQDLSTKTIQNKEDPFGFSKALDDAYNKGVEHCTEIVKSQIDIEPSYTPQRDILSNLINSLNQLKK